MYGIDLNGRIEYRQASFRYFEHHEHHVTRFCEDDVLLLVFSGVLRFGEDGKEYEIRAGKWHIQKHDSEQTGRYESDCPEYLYIHFYGERKDSAFELPDDGEFSPEALMPEMKLMDRLSHSLSSLTERYAAFYAILSQLMHGRDKEVSEAGKIIAYLTMDIRNAPSLEELAKECHFSKNSIITLVKKEYGITPYGYLNAVRLGQSARLMESTSLPLGEIAEQCGFGDYTQFFKAFKRVYKISPGAWRRIKQKEPAKTPVLTEL